MSKYPPNGPDGPIIPKPDSGSLRIDDDVVLEGSTHWVRKRAAEVIYGWVDPTYGRDGEMAREFLRAHK